MIIVNKGKFIYIHVFEPKFCIKLLAIIEDELAPKGNQGAFESGKTNHSFSELSKAFEYVFFSMYLLVLVLG